MGVSVGLVGLGQFGSAFVDLFRAHPLVDRVVLCDRESSRVKACLDHCGADPKIDREACGVSLADFAASDIDAAALFTQPWLHAGQAVQLMEAGKHVYSAVPVVMLPDGDAILDSCARLIATCERTGQLYMLGETTYYRPEAMFCRRKSGEGAFGDIVYAEGEYMHDVDAECCLRDVDKSRLESAAGREWEAERENYAQAGIRGGPMHYPTHSVSGPLSVMNAKPVKVTAYGWRNRNRDPFFRQDAFSNEIALFQMNTGATLRICEAREIAGAFHESETFRILGTAGTFAECTWKENFRRDALTARPLEVTDLTIDDMRDPLPPEVALSFMRLHHPDASDPNAFVPAGHGGSHPYLVHEFLDAVTRSRLPAVNAWDAARYMSMGVTAHQSALRNGETLAVPDFGDPDDNWTQGS